MKRNSSRCDFTRRDLLKLGVVSAAGLVTAGASGLAFPKTALAQSGSDQTIVLDENNCPEIKKANDFARLKYEEAVARAREEASILSRHSPAAYAGAPSFMSKRETYVIPGHSTARAMLDFYMSYYRSVDSLGQATFGEIYSYGVDPGDTNTSVSIDGIMPPVILDMGRTIAIGYGLFIGAIDIPTGYTYTVHSTFYVEHYAQGNSINVRMP